MRLGTFNLSVINYPWGPPYQPNTPICTLFCIQYFNNVDGSWGNFTPWTSIFDAVPITCDLDHVALIAYVGNSDPNDPNSPMKFPTDADTLEICGPYAPVQHRIDDGGSYRLNLNARTGQSGVVEFEAGEWETGEQPAGKSSITPWLIGGVAIGVALAVVAKSRG